MSNRQATRKRRLDGLCLRSAKPCRAGARLFRCARTRQAPEARHSIIDREVANPLLPAEILEGAKQAGTGLGLPTIYRNLEPTRERDGAEVTGWTYMDSIRSGCFRYAQGKAS